MCIFYFGLQGNDCTKDKKTVEEVGRLRRPTSCAVLESYPMEHIFFGVQLCITIWIFNEKSNFDIVIILA